MEVPMELIYSTEEYSFNILSPSAKSCFPHFSTSACVRSSILAGSALLTAAFAAGQVGIMHYRGASGLHHYFIRYTAALLCLLCAVSWMVPNLEWVDFSIAWIMVIQYLIVFLKYWSIGRVILSKWRVYFSSLFLFIVAVGALSTSVLLIDLLAQCSLFPHCNRLHYLFLSVSELMLAGLTTLVAVHICNRFVDVSMTHEMRAAQRFGLFAVAIGFSISAALSVCFDSIIYATETKLEVVYYSTNATITPHYVVSQSTVPGLSQSTVPGLSQDVTPVSTVSSAINDSYSKGKHHLTLKCVEIHTLTQQPVYDTIYTIEMIIRYLVPTWFALLLIRPAKRGSSENDETESIVSETTGVSSVNSESADYRTVTRSSTWQSDHAPNDMTKTINANTESSYQRSTSRGTSNSTGVPNGELRGFENSGAFVAPSRVYMANRDNGQRQLADLVDDLRARYLSEVGAGSINSSGFVATPAPNSPQANREHTSH